MIWYFQKTIEFCFKLLQMFDTLSLVNLIKPFLFVIYFEFLYKNVNIFISVLILFNVVSMMSCINHAPVILLCKVNL